MRLRCCGMAILALALAGTSWAAEADSGTEEQTREELRLTSAAFAADGAIPRRHTGEGQDVSPALVWEGVPEGTRELALICEDPDAPGPTPWVHWVLYGIPAHLEGLAGGDSGNALEGKTSWGRPGYRGPMPPPGHGVHHYHFKLYALDQPLGLSPGISKSDLLAAMKGHILAEAQLIGTYERR